MIEAISSLAQEMRERRSRKLPPYTLFLGLGASLAPGDKASQDLLDKTLASELGLPPGPWSDDQRIEAFFRGLEDLDYQARSATLRSFLKAALPSAGYPHLARLVLDNYFRVIVTSSFDTFLEQALYNAGLWSEMLNIRCLLRDDLDRRVPKDAVELFKLHGEPQEPDFWDSWNQLRCPPRTKRLLVDVLAGHLIMVGYHPRDRLIDSLVAKGKGPLVYVHPEQPPGPEHPLAGAEAVRPLHVISGEHGRFDAFFGALAEEVLYRTTTIHVEQNVGTVSGGTVMGVSIAQVQGNVIYTAQDAVIVGPSEPTEPTPEDQDRPVRGGPTTDPMAEALQSLVSQRTALWQSYDVVQKQAALYGGSTPLQLERQLEQMKQQVREVDLRISELTGEGG